MKTGKRLFKKPEEILPHGNLSELVNIKVGQTLVISSKSAHDLRFLISNINNYVDSINNMTSSKIKSICKIKR